MRYARQNKILDLINTHEIDTQEKLAEWLHKSGFHVTQATISRDIKELRLIKTPAPSGRHRYAVGPDPGRPAAERFAKIFKETIRTVSCAGNLIVIKTLPGCAGAAAETIDSLNLRNVLGSVAGDNTLFLAVNDPANVPPLVARFSEMIR